jgi:hypothetical protein
MQLAAFSLVAAIFALTGGAVFAQGVHPYCAAHQHDCGKTVRLSNCCGGDQDASWTDSAPVQSRVEVHADMTISSALPALVHALATAPAAIAPKITSSPPGLCLLDLPTLFATLLI